MSYAKVLFRIYKINSVLAGKTTSDQSFYRRDQSVPVCCNAIMNVMTFMFNIRWTVVTKLISIDHSQFSRVVIKTD